jgi:replicative DNA helicase
MQPFDAEQLLLSHIITFGNTVAHRCLPQLTPEKFVFNTKGTFGPDHSLLWTLIRQAYLRDNVSPVLPVLTSYCAPHELEYLQTLPKVAHLDPTLVDQLTNLVDKQGLVYNVARHGTALGESILSVEHFMQTLNGIQDIEAWATEQLNILRMNMSAKSVGYEHISEIAERVKTYWHDIYTGKVSPYIESGIPILLANHLFPAGELAVIHGQSGGGKSTFVYQVQMGTAINLFLNDLPGCVAINSLEMTATSLTERLASMLARVDLKKFKAGGCNIQEYDRLLEWIDFVAKLPIFVDDTNFLTTTAMQYRASGLHVSEHGPVIQLSSDYAELFREDDKKLTKEQRVSRVFREQFNLSRLIGASVLAISQSTVDTGVSGKSQIAGPDGLRYSRGALHAADIVAELWNPVQSKKAGRPVVLGKNSSLNTAHPYLLLQKARYGDVGAAIKLGWVSQHTFFFDMSIPQSPGKEVLYTHLEDAVKKANDNK